MKDFGRKGQISLSHMIILLASILAASIAAFIIVDYAGDLDNSGRTIAQRTEEQAMVASQILSIYGEDGSNPQGTLRNFYIKIRPMPGSVGIKLTDTFVGADFEENSVGLYAVSFNESVRNCTPGTGPTDSGFWTNDATSKGNFSYVYITKGPSFKDGYLQRGDTIVICFRAPYEISESKPVGIQFIPKPGIAAIIESATPDEILDVREYFYP